MTIGEVLKLDTDPKSTQDPNFATKEDYLGGTGNQELVKERLMDSCKYQTYRYWLLLDKAGKRPLKASPFLLTFKCCPLSYEACQEKLKNLEKVFPEYFKEYKADPNRQEMEHNLWKIVLTSPKFSPNFCYTTPVLVEIALDENMILQKKIDAHNVMQASQNAQMRRN